MSGDPRPNLDRDQILGLSYVIGSLEGQLERGDTVCGRELMEEMLDILKRVRGPRERVSDPHAGSRKESADQTDAGRPGTGPPPSSGPRRAAGPIEITRRRGDPDSWNLPGDRD